MRIKIISLIIALFCMTLVFGAMAIITNAELTDATVKSYEEQIANVAWQIEQAKKNLANIRNQQSATWVEMGAIDDLIKYNDELKALAEQQLNSLTSQIEETKASIADIESKIEAQEAIRLYHLHTETDSFSAALQGNLQAFYSVHHQVSCSIRSLPEPHFRCSQDMQ